jgi:hypothetical protein
LAIYVDDAFASALWGFWRGGGHLQADSSDELETFAARLGVSPARRQTRRGAPERDHYDLTRAERAQAIALGAVAESARDGARRRDEHRSKP